MNRVVATTREIETQVVSLRLARLKKEREKWENTLRECEFPQLRKSIIDLLAIINRDIEALEPPPA